MQQEGTRSTDQSFRKDLSFHEASILPSGVKLQANKREHALPSFLRALHRQYELKRNLSLDKSKLEDLQWRKLKALLNHSYENVPFYHRKFESAKIKPHDIQDRKDLSKIPVTTKDELQKCSSEFITASNMNLKKCVKTSTSGSTGIPLTLFLDQNMVATSNGLWLRTFQKNGLRFWHKMAVIRHPKYFPHPRLSQKLGIMRRKYISALEDAKEQSKILEEYHPHAIKGYPSSLTQLAVLMKDQEFTFKPHLIFSGAELLDSKARNLINSSFTTEVFDTYGAIEFSLLAWECKEHSGYHINADSVLMEFLDGEENVNAGERGTITCTGLDNYVMPLIRYKLDDVAIPQKEKCSCGIQLPLLSSLQGRENDFLVTPSGHLISPVQFRFSCPIENFAGIKQFRIIQDKPNRIVCRLAVDDRTFDTSSLNEMRSLIQKIMGIETQVDFEILDELEKDNSGKLRVISRSF